MKLILQSNDEKSLAKIIALAKKLKVLVEKESPDFEKKGREHLKKNILNFSSKTSSSFGDAAEWERQQRSDRDLPLS